MNSTASTPVPGIRSIHWLLTPMLSSGTQFQAVAGIVPSIAIKPTLITHVGEAELSVESSNTGNGYQETATLSFKSEEALPQFETLAFIVEEHDGATYLIGSEETPYPLITRTHLKGAPDGEPNVFSYEVKYTSIHAKVKCHVSL